MTTLNRCTVSTKKYAWSSSTQCFEVSGILLQADPEASTQEANLALGTEFSWSKVAIYKNTTHTFSLKFEQKERESQIDMKIIPSPARTCVAMAIDSRVCTDIAVSITIILWYLKCFLRHLFREFNTNPNQSTLGRR